MGTHCRATTQAVKLRTSTRGNTVHVYTVCMPAGALHGQAPRGVMQGKVTGREQAYDARDERRPRRDGLTLVLLHS